jgi:hypothetical protein
MAPPKDTQPRAIVDAFVTGRDKGAGAAAEQVGRCQNLARRGAPWVLANSVPPSFRAGKGALSADGRGFGEGPPASIDTAVITRSLGATPGFVGESVEALVAALKRSDTLPQTLAK